MSRFACGRLALVTMPAAGVLVIGALLAGTLAAQPAFVERPDDQLLIVTVMLGSNTLNEGMLSYWDGERLHVPLLEWAESLDIPIEGSVDEGRAEGWFRSESWRFVLDLDTGLLSVNGFDRSREVASIERHISDFYVPLERLRDWFDLDIELRLNDSRLDIGTGQGLVIEQRIERERRWALQSRTGDLMSTNGPIVSAEPAWLAWPVVDLNLSAGVDEGLRPVSPPIDRPGDGADDGRNDDNSSSEPTTLTSFGFDLLAAGDLLRSSGNLSLNYRDGGTLGRSSIDTRLRLDNHRQGGTGFGWSAGDILSPLLPLLSGQSEGVGIAFGDLDDRQTLDLTRTTLTGEALNGWDVEVYRNEELLAFTRIEASNRYQFDDIPLRPGLNLFRIVLYGPQGQRRERLERIVIGDRMLEKGQQRWQSFAVLRDRRLLPGSDALAAGRMLAASDSLMAGSRYQRALSKRWLLGLDAMSAGLDDGRQHHYLALHSQNSIDNWLFESRMIKDVTGGVAVRAAVQALGTENDLLLDAERFTDFASIEVNGIEDSDRLLERLRLRWNSTAIAGLPMTAELERRRYGENGDRPARDLDAARIRFSRRFGHFSTSTSVAAKRETGLADLIDGGLLLSYRRSNLDLTSQWSYRLSPATQLRDINVNATWTFSPRMRLRSTLRRAFEDGADSRATLSAIWIADTWTASATLGYDSTSGYTLGASLFTSLQRVDDRWLASARSATTSASASAQVFLDHDGDGRFGAGDEPLPGVNLRAGFAGKLATTDPEGRALLPHLLAGEPSPVHLVENSLEDVYWQPIHTNQQVLAGPGQTVDLSFPVLVTVEVYGKVTIVDARGERPAGKVRLQLTTEQGAVVMERASEFDGFYVFDRVVPGRYLLRIDPAQVERLDLRPSAPVALHLGGENASDAAVDWRLHRNSASPTH